MNNYKNSRMQRKNLNKHDIERILNGNVDELLNLQKRIVKLLEGVIQKLNKESI